MSATSISPDEAINAELCAERERFVPTLDAGPIKILHIINDLSIGGAEMLLYRLLCQHSRQFFDPVVLSLMDRGSLRPRIEELGIPVYTAGMSSGLPGP